MSKPILLLRLEGPLQSWGGRSRWDVRDTQPEPTKSGIVGLLGCALGYERGDVRLVNELDTGLRFGVRVEEPGRILEDFQTITDFLPTADGRYRHSGVAVGASLDKLRANSEAAPATILSPRSYLEDAAFLVGLESSEAASSGLLARCAAALQEPHWPLFLGRKCCPPTRPILEGLTDAYDGLEDALQTHPWSWLGRERRLRADARQPQTSVMLTAYVEDPAGPLQRQDAVRLNAARFYGFRSVRPLSPISLTALKGED